MQRELILNQDKSGYRYNRDSFILADFFRQRDTGSVLDLGAGAGVLSILIGRRHPQSHITGIEIMEKTARNAMENAKSSGVDGFNMVVGDALNSINLFGENRFDYIVSNPPYKKAGSGRLNEDPAEAVARHEIKITLEDIVRLSSKLLRSKGSLTISMVNDRRDEYVMLLAKYGFFETRFREVKPLPDGVVNIFLSEAKPGSDGTRSIEQPLVLRSANGGDSEEFKAIMARHA